MAEFEASIGIPTGRYSCACYIPTLAIIIWIALSFNPKGPRCYIQEFYVPALDLTQSNPNSTMINPYLFFDLALVNVLTDRSVRYGDVNLTFSYGQNAVAKYTVPKFFQGKGKTAHRREVVETSGMPWDDALKVVLNGSKAVFRVDLAARPKFRFWFWNSKKKGVRIGANVEVDGSGLKVKEDDIRLSSALKPVIMGKFVMFSSHLVAYFLLY